VSTTERPPASLEHRNRRDVVRGGLRPGEALVCGRCLAEARDAIVGPHAVELDVADLDAA